MAKFTKWIKKAIESLVDPEKEKRIKTLVARIRRDIREKRHQFSLKIAIHGLQYTSDDLEVAKERVYRRILENAWTDERLTRKER